MARKSSSTLARTEARTLQSRGTLDELFPFHVVFDKNQIIKQVGRSVRHLLPNAEAGTVLGEVFRVAGPLDIARIAGTGAVLELGVPNRPLVLRGPIYEAADLNGYVLHGQVWTAGPLALEKLGLDAKDFLPADPTFSLLSELSNYRDMGSERRLVDVLTEQRAELRRTNRRIRALYEISVLLHQSKSLDQLGVALLEIVSDALRGKYAALYQIEASGDPTLIALHDARPLEEGEHFPSDADLVATACEARRPLFLEHAAVFPVEVQGEVAAVLELGGEFPSDVHELIEDVGRQLASFMGRERATHETRRARDDAEAATRLKSAFLATMSHEIRTPLNAVIGLMDLLRESDLRSGELEYVQLAQDAGQSLLRVLSDVMDFAKVESGQLELREQPIDLEELITRASDPYRLRARAKGIELRVQIDRAMPPWVSGDSDRIAQVLIQLLDNAVKFTDKGEILVRARPRTKKPGRVRFEVIDTGVGLPPRAAETIFLPFRQLDSTTTRRHGGTGLGLAVAHGLVERMGGSIECEGAPHAGSRFAFELELKACVAPAPAVAPAERTRRPGSGRILIAEDNVVNQRLLRGLLEHLGYEVQIVDDGAEVLRAHRNDGPFDAIIMDWQMPVLDGLEATRRIRSEEPTNGRRTPVIALTAHAAPEDRDKCLAAGMDDYLTKPVGMEQLERTLGRWATTRRQSPGPRPQTALPQIPLEVIEVFIDDAPRRVAQIKTALERGDQREASRHAHTLKGAAAAVGAIRVHDLAGEIEDRTRAGDALDDAMKTRLSRAAAELEKVGPLLLERATV